MNSLYGNYCDWCFGRDEFKTDRGLRIHYGKVHRPKIAECEKTRHHYDEYGTCTNCQSLKRWEE